MSSPIIRRGTIDYLGDINIQPEYDYSILDFDKLDKYKKDRYKPIFNNENKVIGHTYRVKINHPNKLDSKDYQHFGMVGMYIKHFDGDQYLCWDDIKYINNTRTWRNIFILNYMIDQDPLALCLTLI